MNYQDKFTTRSSKLKVYRANSQTISSYPVKFSTDSLFFFSFFCSFFSFFFFCLLVLFFCFKSKIYILKQIRLCRLLRDKKFSPGRFPEKRLLFFSSYCCNIIIQSFPKVKCSVNTLIWINFFLKYLFCSICFYGFLATTNYNFNFITAMTNGDHVILGKSFAHKQTCYYF